MPTRQPVCQEEVYEQGDYKRNRETFTIFWFRSPGVPMQPPYLHYKWRHNPGQGIGHVFLEALGSPLPCVSGVLSDSFSESLAGPP